MAADTLSISSATLRHWRDNYDYTSGLSPAAVTETPPPPADVPDLSPVQDSGGNALGDLFQWLGALPQAVWIVLLTLLLALAAYFVLKHTDRKRRRKKSKTDDADETDGGTEDIYEIDDYVSPIDSAVAQGEWAEAVRLVYLATLRHLDETGRIHWERHKTPMEYVDEAGDDELLPLTLMYLSVRFGHYPANEAQYHEAVRLRNLIEKGGSHA